ncbi:MAG: IPT/TIG domain-containing protein [Planctomycetales bacterium]|nr:IPT/TIG domain-containing protein [Planctomycetales bacterium]
MRRATALAALALVLTAAGCQRKHHRTTRTDAPATGYTIATIAPTQGPTTGGTRVTITGSGFVSRAASSVEFAGVAGTSFVVTGETQLEVTTPAGTAGAASVAVLGFSVGPLSATEPGGFLYLSGAAPAPTVSSAAPAFGSISGGTVVTVSGTGFQTGATVSFGSAAATAVVVNSASRLTATTAPSTPATVSVTVTNPDTQTGTLANGYTYVSPNAQTGTYVFDTSSGIDCRRRWYVNFASNSYVKDLQNLGLQTWGTPGDSTAPPSPLPPTDQYALDWARAYTLRTLNVAYGRNGDGTKVSGTSLNVTFVGLAPASGAPGCLIASTDWGMVCVGGCDPAGDGGPHPSASQAACFNGALGAALFDSFLASSCNQGAEITCDQTYHNCGSCGTTGTGIFSSLVANNWGATLPGGRLTSSDLPFVDGSTTTGFRYLQIHDFLKQWARRVAFIVAHECGHAMGLVASSATGTCTFNSTQGLCGASPAHNDCCSTNVMQTAATWVGPGLLTDTSIAFSGQPGSVSSPAFCSTGGVSSWALLQSFVGTSP